MAWIVSGILLSILLSPYSPRGKLRSFEVTRSKRSICIFWVWTVRYMFLGKIFIEITENATDIFFSNSQNFQRSKIEDSSLLTHFNFHRLVKTKRFFIHNCILDDSRSPLFLTLLGWIMNMTSLWRFFIADLSEPRKFRRWGCVKLIKKGARKIGWRYLLSIFIYRRISGEPYRNQTKQGNNER